MAHNANQGDSEGLLYETGDRWKLDTLIPDSQRLLVGPQVERTSKPKIATKPAIVKDTLNHERSYHTPIYTRHETGLDEQARLRRRYSSDEALPNDILL